MGILERCYVIRFMLEGTRWCGIEFLAANCNEGSICYVWNFPNHAN